MEFIKFIIMLMCVTMFTSQLWIVNSISLVSGPKDARIAVGADVIFICSVTDNYYSYPIRWIYNRTYISLDSSIYNDWPVNSESIYTIIPDSFNLKISNVQLTDAGKYECGYDPITDDQYYRVFHPDRAVATLSVLQPPSANSPLCWIGDAIEVMPAIQVYVGESIKFKCSSKGHGNTSPSLNITESNNDITEHVFQDSFDWKQVESDELKIKNVDIELKCYLESEALIQPKVCEIKLNVLFPLVEIEPRSASVLESSNISFQCSGSEFKTADLQYYWKISPDVPGEIVSFTSSALEITNIGENTTILDIAFIVTCFVREGQMVWNSSSSLSISPKKHVLTNNINNNNESAILLTSLVVGILVTTVVVAIIMILVFRLRHRKRISVNKLYGGHLNTGALKNEQLHSVVQNKNINAHDSLKDTGQKQNTSGLRADINLTKCLNVPVGYNESAVYYSTVPAENNQEPDNYDNIGQNIESVQNEPLYENKDFTPDNTELNVEGLNYADLDLEIELSRDIIDTGNRTTYTTVTVDANK